MSWMDSWSRPSKSQSAPPPFYLTHPSSAYCHTCGRVIGSRRMNNSKASSTEAKYCSARCKSNKPGAVDKRIDSVLLVLLQGKDSQQEPTGKDNDSAPSTTKRRLKKGDPRIVVKMSDLEAVAFRDTKDPERVYGRYKKRAKRGVPDANEWRSIDMEDGAQQPQLEPVGMYYDYYMEYSALTNDGSIASQTRVRPPQANSDVNGSIGGEKGWSERIEETPEMLQKRLEGQKRADNRELARNAARRAVTFGLLVEENDQRAATQRGYREEPKHTLKMCEALMNGTVVDPSFAKGDWEIRWRED